VHNVDLLSELESLIYSVNNMNNTGNVALDHQSIPLAGRAAL
jgi:hypothetical protein